MVLYFQGKMYVNWLLCMVYRLMKELIAVYKYNMKQSTIYNIYQMCTGNNKIRLLQHELASNSQFLD